MPISQNKECSVAKAAMDFHRAECEVRSAVHSYKDKCDLFVSKHGEMPKKAVIVGELQYGDVDPMSRKFLKFTEKEYSALKRAKQLKYNAKRRLDRACISAR